MNAKKMHTPGPWAVENSGDRVEIVDEETLLLSIAFVRQRGKKGEQEANARLIAAAPESAQGCVDLVSILHATHAKCGFGVPFTPQNNPCDCTQHRQYHAARATIAKAKGEA
jgi:hypothetical protein